ncbi:MAG: ABC transporter ATP-binding protein [Promethearchaeota archaeon]|nr:MAG: ABC transporter ATP-binding protein [Candidatus Lokiarchaeota archaeon]
MIKEEKVDKSEIVLKLENLTKRFGDLTAVNNINLEVHRGETIGLVGPNGAGKTTTIKMIAKILRPNSGRILIRSNHSELQDLNKISRTISQIGFLIDIPAFYNMTAYQLLRYFANLQNYPKNKINQRIDELLERFKLSEWKYKPVKTFSKGMTQKIGIIQALIHDPEIIILDEPQTGLDPLARVEIRKYIRELQSLGKTIFVASHMLYEISEVCDKIALINYGSIIGFDTVENLALTLKTSELNCVLLEPIKPSELEPLINLLTERLDPYLDKDLDPMVSKIPVKYYPEQQGLKIFYDGRNESKGDILKTLIKEFESDFTVISFTQPRTSQLERVYAEMVKDNDSKEKNILNKEV